MLRHKTNKKGNSCRNVLQKSYFCVIFPSVSSSCYVILVVAIKAAIANCRFDHVTIIIGNFANAVLLSRNLSTISIFTFSLIVRTQFTQYSAVVMQNCCQLRRKFGCCIRYHSLQAKKFK